MLKLGIRNWVLVGIMAILFIVVAKVIVNKYPLAGLTDVVNAV
jgi:hypothetical protein